jgi:uncharacterized protein (DUF2164 family)
MFRVSCGEIEICGGLTKKFTIDDGVVEDSERSHTSQQKACMGHPRRGEQMTNIEISKEQRKVAIASIQRYLAENLETTIGELPAGLLLNFFLEEIGPAIYNQAVKDAQTRVQMRVADLDGDLFVPEFEYWERVERKKKR